MSPTAVQNASTARPCQACSNLPPGKSGYQRDSSCASSSTLPALGGGLVGRGWPTLRRWLAWGVLSVLTSGCGKESVGFASINVLSEGVINDPANKSLRFDLLKFGLEQFCQEMQGRGVALKLQDGTPNVGRFFATSCQSEVIDESQRQTIVVRYAGRGYGWTNVTQRLGFETQGLVEYAPDFQMHEGAMYIYFRPRNVDSASFTTTLIESAMAQTGVAITGVQPNELGKNIVMSQLRRGFTVVRYSESGETELGMGVIPLGQRPFHPFQVLESDKLTLDNDRTEVHSGQQDYIGGFSVKEDDQALYLTMTVDGAPNVDVLLVDKGIGDTTLATYTSTGGASVPGAVPFTDVVNQGQRYSQVIPVPPGSYYLVLDHSDRVGRSSPPTTALDDRAARVDYLVQVGDRP